MNLELKEFVDELQNEGIDVSIKDASTEEIAEVFATKCSCGWRCGSCSGCKSRSTITAESFNEEPEEKLAA